MKTAAKYLFYKILCPLLLALNVDKLLRIQSANRRMVIMYHGVSGRKNFSINGRHLPRNEFENQLKYFRKNFHIVPLDELCNIQRPVASHTIALTFDDGYLNNVQHAIPLLKKYEIPATFFIASASLTEKEYLHPPDYIDIVGKVTPHPISINGTLFHRRNGQLTSSKGTAYNYINSLDFNKFNDVLKTLKSTFPIKDVGTAIDPEVYKVVTAETVKELVSDKLFTVGSHSHDHVNLNTVSKDEAYNQLANSKKLLEGYTETIVDRVAFPYGYFNEDVVECSAQVGYRYLFAGGAVADEWKHHVFPRIGILNMAGFAFNMLSINRGFKRFGF